MDHSFTPTNQFVSAYRWSVIQTLFVRPVWLLARPTPEVALTSFIHFHCISLVFCGCRIIWRSLCCIFQPRWISLSIMFLGLVLEVTFLRSGWCTDIVSIYSKFRARFYLSTIAGASDTTAKYVRKTFVGVSIIRELKSFEKIWWRSLWSGKVLWRNLFSVWSKFDGLHMRQ